MMSDGVEACVVINALNEAATIGRQLDALRAQVGGVRFEVLVADNGSSDGTPDVVLDYARRYPSFALSVCSEERKGVALALRRGLDVAAARGRAYLVAAHAESIVEERFVSELIGGMRASGADLGVADCYYSAAHFATRPRLWEIIDVTMEARAFLNRLLGGFPEGKGFAVRREMYERVGGVEILYQMKDGAFVPHPTDDLDFGVRVVAHGGRVAFCERSRVEIHPRRVDEQLDEMIAGRAYGSNGVFDMANVRAPEHRPGLRDVTEEEGRSLWGYSLKDVVIRGVLLPLLLDPRHCERAEVRDVLSDALAGELARRIPEMREEMRLIDFTPIHSYKPPCYRLYFEFGERICARLAERLHPRFADVPPLPPPLAAVRARGDEEWRTFVRYYCEDRESGEAHNYFGTGVF
jgi:GT2 family glycosyltransferase